MKTRSVLECGSPLPLWNLRNKQRKRSLRSLLCAFCFILLHSSFNLHAQSYALDWSTIDGGGGTSSGGVYSVSGTIGQPDASITPMSGGSFSITGGFWSLLSAVQTPGAPLLTITLTTTNTALVSWAYPSTGFSLQQNTNLSTTNWIVPAQTVTNNGTINFIIINPPTGNRFYRLKSP
ncbi:MAG: hypothetical protein EPO07_17450 [Verrucomicrobia bacterium]|nr:MAG: hypothetical protein EPO07_17450 [Verrucomicrobiota bacterium]